MSPEQIPGEDASKASPQGSEELSLFDIAGEKSEREASAALWYGVAMGLIFIMGAYWANGFIEENALAGSLPPTWYDWVWVVVAALGLVGSFAISSHLASVRKPGDPPYDMFAAIGGAVSVVILILLLIESFGQVRSALSLSEIPLWPDAKPLWFMPLSVLGVTLPIVALLFVRGGDSREKALGIALACAPVMLLSIPLIYGFDEADKIRWIPTIFAVTGLALAFSGLRPVLYLSGATLESLEYLATRVFIVVLVFAGLMSWRGVSGGDLLSPSADLVWFLPLVASLVLSAMLLAVAWKAPGKRYNLLPEAMGLSGLVWSAVLVFMFSLGFIDVWGLGETRTLWLYPLSLAGVTMVMIGVNFLGKGTRTDRTVGVVCAMVPTIVTGMIVLVSEAMEALSEQLPGTSDEVPSWTVSHPLLSEEMALYAYLGFALAVLISGLRVETFWKMQLPILREKSSLSRKRMYLILRQMLRNPMGLIGSVILVFFVLIAAIGPYIAPYEVDMTINGDFDPFELPSSRHWMGVDNLGHDVFSELLYGARTSIIVGIVAAAISSILGAAIGLYSGYVGGWKDEVIMRLNDIVLSIPWLVLMIIIAAFMGSIDLMGIILVIGLTGWSGTARLVRAQVLSLRERQYIERARAIGSDDAHIINKHILPNAFPLVFANTILTVAVSILSEATLSFLGLRPQGTVTWGTMLSYAQAANAFSLGLHWWIVAPGLCIVFVVLGFTLLGYALDDVMNPKLRKR